tara:strand:- start:198 stop:1226 length:1029 start_codon:yes stop_codon:yes gene_type:complete
MYAYAKYYLTPLLAPAVLAGILLGGHWMWLGIGVIFLVLIGGDAIFGKDTSQPKYAHPRLVEIPLHLALPFLTALLLALAWSAKAHATTAWTDYLGAVLGVGFLTVGYGLNVGHELTHRITSREAMIEGRWLLAMSCTTNFSIEHVYGHHVRVGTDADPATARRGENVYFFFLRSTVMGHLSAWGLEMDRLKVKKQWVLSWNNRILRGYLMSCCWMGVSFFIGGPLALVLFLGQSLFAKFVLEVVNYMEHYGLRRKENEPAGPHHSWNTNQRISEMVLFSLTRHSAHHEKPAVPFWRLDACPDAPEMPHGYLTTIVFTLIPPLWNRIMSPRLKQWDEKYGMI